MRRNIHPVYYEGKVIATDGTEFMCGSTKDAFPMRATYDKYNHAAWNNDTSKQVKTGREQRFQDKYKPSISLDSLFGGS